jgi:hypothetical protein
MTASDDILPIGVFTQSVSAEVRNRKPPHRAADDVVYRPNAFGADWTLDVRPPGEPRRSVSLWKQGDVVFVSRRDGVTPVGAQQTVRRDRHGVAGVAELVAWIWDGGTL